MRAFENEPARSSGSRDGWTHHVSNQQQAENEEMEKKKKKKKKKGEEEERKKKRKKKQKRNKKKEKTSKKKHKTKQSSQRTMEEDFLREELAKKQRRELREKLRLERIQRERVYAKGFSFGDLKVIPHARWQWSLRRKGGTLNDLLIALDTGKLQFKSKRQLDNMRWLITASNGVGLVLSRDKTKIITVLRESGYDYAREEYEQRLHAIETAGELPWGELMPEVGEHSE